MTQHHPNPTLAGRSAARWWIDLWISLAFMRRAEEMSSADMPWEMVAIHLTPLITHPLNTHPCLLADLQVDWMKIPLDRSLSLTSMSSWSQSFTAYCTSLFPFFFFAVLLKSIEGVFKVLRPEFVSLFHSLSVSFCLLCRVQVPTSNSPLTTGKSHQKCALNLKFQLVSLE